MLVGKTLLCLFFLYFVHPLESDLKLDDGLFEDQFLARLRHKWMEWKFQTGRKYFSRSEENNRFKIWAQKFREECILCFLNISRIFENCWQKFCRTYSLGRQMDFRSFPYTILTTKNLAPQASF